MYPLFLEAGYSPLLFWELSLGEVIDCIEAYEKKISREQRDREAATHDETYMLYMQALQFGNVMSCIFDKKAKLKGLEVYYPGLYGNTKKTEENQEESDNFTEKEGDINKLTVEMEAYKADMDDFIFRHNLAMAKKRGESGNERNDIGEATSNYRSPDEGLL